MLLAPWAVGVLIAVTVVRSGLACSGLAAYALIVVVALAVM
jgi:hypothetical protein